MPSARDADQPELPEYMTWEELEVLPDEVAAQIELWDGRVVWLRRGPGEHQTAMRRLTNEIGHAELPPGVRPLRSANYLMAGERTPDAGAGVSFPYPFPIEVPWSSLAF